MIQAIIDLIKLVYEVAFHPLVFVILSVFIVGCMGVYMHFKAEIDAWVAKIKGDL